MKFSEQWLREWINPGVDTAALSHQLTMCGLEVDAIEPVAAEFSGVLVGEVLSVEQHPDADRLRVCQVNVGTETLSIVCGAPNVAVGLKVPTAIVGAKLPNDFKIKKSKLRGVQSFGMLCSEAELGLADSAEGLMLLPADAEPGTNVRDCLQLDDVVIEVGLTPNRGDCLSILGVAREVAVMNQQALIEPEMDDVVISQSQTFPVELRAADACPRYIGRVIKGVNPKAETPLWLKERLRRSGVRAISPVVDVTNYVMLELGQPMHAFDLAKLNGGIKVRLAEEGEAITLLDGQEVKLQPNTLVIADHQQAVAMAGIMGGEVSAVSDETQDIFLESAFFAPDAIVGRARQYGLHTDSSHRFERGVDYELPAKAMKRATALLLAIVGGEAGPLVDANNAELIPKRNEITLRVDRIKRLLGIELSQKEVTEMLMHLGMKVREQGKTWSVIPPSFRFDLAIEADLIEEVARIFGYSNLPTEILRLPMQINLAKEAHIATAQFRDVLVGRGYQEVITYSFVAADLQKLILPDAEPIELANPISAEMAVMRCSLWPGMLQSLSYNQNRQQGRVRVFESGVKFFLQNNEIKEEKVFSGLVAGTLQPEQWGSKAQAVDFYDVKADIEALLGLTRNSNNYVFEAKQYPALHSGQSATIKTCEGVPIGMMGKLHPAIEAQLGVNGPVYLFELIDSALRQAAKPQFQELSKFPSVRRDLALVVGENVTVHELKECITGVSGQYLTNLQLFDVYCGEGVESGRKSLALGLTFQNSSRTLIDTEIDDLVSKVLEQLDQRFNATLRD